MTVRDAQTQEASSKFVLSPTALEEMQNALGHPVVTNAAKIGDMEQSAATARRIYDYRRQRDAMFGDHAVLFGEPAWDILLDLYHCELNGRSVSVSDGCVAGSKSVSAGMRHIKALTSRGLVKRVPDLSDGRRSWLNLTEHGQNMMQQLMNQMMSHQIQEPSSSATPERWTQNP